MAVPLWSTNLLASDFEIASPDSKRAFTIVGVDVRVWAGMSVGV